MNAPANVWISPQTDSHPVRHIDHVTLLHVRAGSGLVEINQRSWPLRPGCTLLVPPGRIYHLRNPHTHIWKLELWLAAPADLRDILLALPDPYTDLHHWTE